MELLYLPCPCTHTQTSSFLTPEPHGRLQELGTTQPLVSRAPQRLWEEIGSQRPQNQVRKDHRCFSLVAMETNTDRLAWCKPAQF